MLRPNRISPILYRMHIFVALVFLSFLMIPVQTVSAQGAAAKGARVQDMGIQSQFQDHMGNQFRRGRALVAADFDLDGQIDLYMGSPGDESFVMRNVSMPGRPSFQLSQVLLVGELAWGASAADYDNDGDYDLYISCGANEGECYDFLFKNMLMEEGSLRFEDVTATAGIKGPVPLGAPDALPVASANGVWGDFDQDGDDDLFVSVNIWKGTAMDGPVESSEFARPRNPVVEADNLLGRNVLWLNNGDGTFTDVTDLHGLGTTRLPSRHSTFLDIDNDGDLDIYENNNGDTNVLWRNLLSETGTPDFEDVTTAFSPPGEDLNYPIGSFSSCSADFNGDGWEDIIAFVNQTVAEAGTPYQLGHALFINQQGTGFVNVAEPAMLNNPHIGDQGVMGSQVGDLNGDGVPDVFIGNGGPPIGQHNQLYISDSQPGATPHYVNMSSIIDYPAPEASGVVYPTFPYRTHGTAFIDIDGDGKLEMAVLNGGPALLPDFVREPNRLFSFQWPRPSGYFRVRPVGDGVSVSKDAVGARVALTVSKGSRSWTLYQTLFAGRCFSAQNGFDLHFLVGQANSIDKLVVTWPDGSESTVVDGLSLNSSVVVTYTGQGQQPLLSLETPRYSAKSEAKSVSGQVAGDRSYELSDVYPMPFQQHAQFSLSVSETQVVRIEMFDLLGRSVSVLHDGDMSAGDKYRFAIDGSNLPGGVYLIRATGRTFTASRQVVLVR